MSSDDSRSVEEFLKDALTELENMTPEEVEALHDRAHPNPSDIECYNYILDVYAYKTNPNTLPTTEDLDVSWPSFRDRRFQ